MYATVYSNFNLLTISGAYGGKEHIIYTVLQVPSQSESIASYLVSI